MYRRPSPVNPKAPCSQEIQSGNSRAQTCETNYMACHDGGMTEESRDEHGPVVIALGGNALQDDRGDGTVEDQLDVVERTAGQVSAVVEAGHEVVLTHGNGPQVGNLLLQQESAPETRQFPLDVLVAQTQAMIGYLLQQALTNELDGSTNVTTLVTQTVVDKNDPAFEDPTKPVGPFYTEQEAEQTPFETRKVAHGDRPYRRVVPSPDPVEIVESDEIRRLVERGSLVICGGGGGVPVARDDGLRGVEAVIDKDRATRLLAEQVDAETLVVLTDVEYAYLDYGSPDQRPLEDVTPEQLRKHLDAGEFGEGSMKPKVEAALGFVEDGGGRAVITSADNLRDALDGDTGTQVQK